MVSIYSFREAKKARIWSVFFVEDEGAGHSCQTFLAREEYTDFRESRRVRNMPATAFVWYIY